MKNNTYLPFRSEILEVIKHADLEYTFRMTYDRGAEHPVKPGQFFEISIPKYGGGAHFRQRHHRPFPGFHHPESGQPDQRNL